MDIVFTVATEYEYEDEYGDTEFGIKDLLSNVQFIINDEVMEEEVDFEEGGWHKLVMFSFALPEGDLTIEIKNNDGKAKMVPQLKDITLYSSAIIEAKAEEAE